MPVEACVKGLHSRAVVTKATSIAYNMLRTRATSNTNIIQISEDDYWMISGTGMQPVQHYHNTNLNAQHAQKHRGAGGKQLIINFDCLLFFFEGVYNIPMG